MNQTFLEDPIPLSVLVPWAQAYPRFYWYWIIEILESYLGALLNVSLLFVFLSSIPNNKSEKIVESKEAKILFMSLFCVDLLQGLWIGSVALMNFISHQFVGGQTFCSVHTLVIGSFSFLSLGIMGMMSLHLFMRVTNTEKQLLPLKQLYFALGLVWIILVPCLVYVPGGAILDASGIVCLPNYISPVTKLFFAVVLLMISLVGINYFRIYKYYSKITQGTEDEKVMAKKKKLIWRFSLMIFVSFGTFGPYGTTLIYAWATNYYAPAIYEMIAMFFWNLTVVMNPILYYSSNDVARKVILIKLNIIDHISATSNSSVNSTDQKVATSSSK